MTRVWLRNPLTKDRAAFGHPENKWHMIGLGSVKRMSLVNLEMGVLLRAQGNVHAPLNQPQRDSDSRVIWGCWRKNDYLPSRLFVVEFEF